MCTSLYYSNDKCTGQLLFGSILKDGLTDPRGFLENQIPYHAKEQANQDIRQEYHHSQHALS